MGLLEAQGNPSPNDRIFNFHVVGKGAFAAYILAHFFGGANLYFSYPIGWVIGLVIAASYYLKGPWKEKAIARLKIAEKPL